MDSNKPLEKVYNDMLLHYSQDNKFPKIVTRYTVKKVIDHMKDLSLKVSNDVNNRLKNADLL